MEDLEYLLSGSGNATVVFLNGFRMPFSSWDQVYPAVAERYKVLLYNRRGVGKSKKADLRQNGEVVVEELQWLLKKLHLQPPYVLVAHSLGGIYANLFARTFNNEVAAVVFVDSPTPEEIPQQKRIKTPAVFNVMNNFFKSIEKFFDPFKYSEDEEILITLEQIHKARSFPDRPTAVVSGSKKMPFIPQKAFAIHQQHQKELLKLSSSAKYYEGRESGHFPQITEPKVVINAIMETIEKVG